ncbi:MAG: MFS transporter [Betaproteobacteria bacterium]|nr:MFS transporter [Betaproteobacteria bacterium]
MPRPPERDAASPPTRIISLYETLAIVLLWNAGYKGVRVASTLYALELGAGPFDTGLLLAVYGLFPLMLAVQVGKIGDRYGVRLPIVAGTVVSALGILLPWIWPAYPMLFVSAAVCGAGFILVQVSMQSLVGSLGSGRTRTLNLNWYALVVSTSDLLGPVTAGFSIDHFGYVRTYLHLALLTLASVVALFFVARRLPHGATSQADRSQQRMSDLFRNHNMRRMLLTSGLVMGGLDLFQLYLPLHGHSVGLSASAIGVILGAFAAAAFVTRALLPTLVRRVGEEAALCHAMFLSAGTFFLIPMFQDPLVLAVVCFVLGLGMGLGQPLTVMLTYNYSPAGRHGEGLGLRIAINNTMHVSVPAVFGAIGALFGLAPVFWASSAMLAAGGYTARRSPRDP